MKKFECHITLSKPQTPQNAKWLFDLAKNHKMKTSWITGDPVLGVGKWFYISGYSESFEELLISMKKVVKELQNNNMEVVREKIEQIMYDTKTNYFECGVNCFACLEE